MKHVVVVKTIAVTTEMNIDSFSFVFSEDTHREEDNRRRRKSVYEHFIIGA